MKNQSPPSKNNKIESFKKSEKKVKKITQSEKNKIESDKQIQSNMGARSAPPVEQTTVIPRVADGFGNGGAVESASEKLTTVPEPTKARTGNLNKKTRWFSLVSYLPSKELVKVLNNHSKSIRGCCYILHYKETTEKHYHCLIRTYGSWTTKQILRWFSGVTDDSGQYINTLGEPMNDPAGMLKYITHQDFESVKAGKPRYEFSDITDSNFIDSVDLHTDCPDSSLEIIKDIIRDTSALELVKRYGRDYVYHYNNYHEIARIILQQSCFKPMNESKPIIENNNAWEVYTLDELKEKGISDVGAIYMDIPY